jgi:chromosome segregation ATPase
MVAEMTELSTSKELEDLGSKKAVLQAESRSLKEEQQSLEERTKVLEEEIAVEMLKNDNRTAREAISRLKSKVEELEQRLKEASRTPETGSTNEAKPEIPNPPELKQESTMGIAQAGMEETEEDVVTVMPLESPMTTEPGRSSEDLKKQQEKKKRKFL